VASARSSATLRESRRSEPVPRSPGLGSSALRTARCTRVSAHAGSENLAPPAGVATAVASRGGSKWVAAGSSATRMQRTTSRQGGALHDITNVAGCRGYGKSAKLPEVSVQRLADRAKAVMPQTRVASSAAPQTASVSSTSNIILPAPQPAEGGANVACIEGEVSLEKEQGVAEYVPDIFNHLFTEEAAFMARPTYMESQVDINAKMRAILIDWLVEVHMKYKLRLETLFLTINLIDRYLMRMPVIRKRLQLVGVVAMFVACKFEEIEPPRIQDFVYITDNAYTKEDIVSMECTMLTTLSFKIVAPTPAHLLHRLLSANRCDDRHRQLVQYILELALLDLKMVRHTPSHLVASALLLSNELMGRRLFWPSPMVSHTRYTEHALRACAEELRALLDDAPQYFLQAIRKKFSHERYLSVARMPCLATRKEAVQ